MVMAYYIIIIYIYIYFYFLVVNGFQKALNS